MSRVDVPSVSATLLSRCWSHCVCSVLRIRQGNWRFCLFFLNFRNVTLLDVTGHCIVIRYNLRNAFLLSWAQQIKIQNKKLNRRWDSATCEPFSQILLTPKFKTPHFPYPTGGTGLPQWSEISEVEFGITKCCDLGRLCYALHVANIPTFDDFHYLLTMWLHSTNVINGRTNTQRASWL